MNRFKKFISYYRPYKGLLTVDILCAFAVSAATLAIPLCTREITKSLTDGTADISFVYGMGGLMLAFIVVLMLCSWFIDYRGHAMGAMMERDMRSELFDHYLKLPHSFHDEQQTGQLMERITGDILCLTELYHHGPEDFTIGLLKFFGAFVILTGINVKLTLAAFALLPVMAALSFYYNKKMNTALRVGRDRAGDINARAEQALSGIRTVKSFAGENVERGKFGAENERFCDSRKEVYKKEAEFTVCVETLAQLISLSVIIFGGIAILSNSIDLADLITFLLYIGILIEPIHRFMNFARLYQEGITAFDRVMDILEIQPDITDSPNAVNIERAKGGLEFRDVTFKYRDEYPHVLKNLSFSIQPGEYVAIVGSSGAGKTTLCSLIPRFYDVGAGTVLLDGLDVREISQASLRDNIGIVQQDIYLFGGTVAENIRYGKPDATMEEIIDAAKLASAHEFISQLPNGYDSEIGQRGVLLSGGQKQRISIARVFLKNPPVFIFDEATSALDNDSERAVHKSLERLTAGRTTIVIAHRLSTIKNAKRIIVLSERGILEEGTHEELINKGGEYAALYSECAAA